ncbi:gamma-butyrobetaine hydroxylase-like domain-containing protein [Hirschia maritima]|uniref:gamma-butyrobetaine hydroxylase-like domain-containing protein n=1 Tax=Hirschia maritima TaxID=1121961 RepID=UPI00037DA445|nr:gamma-butyrobetaine hydroxylase-like domain-containing protein [Hirschia maritima]
MFKKQRPSDDGSWPVEIRFNKAKAIVSLEYDDGFKGEIPYELLRVESPSAETRGHSGQTPVPVAGKKDVSVIGADPVGRYALRISFSDGHDSGLYSWPFLKDLSANQKSHMKAYQKRLKEHGLNRD